MKKPIALFAYDFPHRKTHDFILELRSCGVRDIVVLAAPKKQLPDQDSRSYFRKSLLSCPPLATQELCEALDLKYFKVAHDNVTRIDEIKKSHNIDIAIISGARIIPGDVIELFSGGVVNFHPGKIPQTSGLDAFYYTIKHAVCPGVTTHFIDDRVDAGEQIYFDEVRLFGSETPEVLVENVYQMQRIALRRLVEDLRNGAVTSTAIDRPKKNEPMASEDKVECLAAFSEWLAARAAEQQDAT